MHVISSYRGNRPTNTLTHKQTTHRLDRLQYTAPQLARNVTMKQHTKRKVIDTLRPRIVETVAFPRTGVLRLRGVFLANHLVSTDNLTRTTTTQNTYQHKVTTHKKWL